MKKYLFEKKRLCEALMALVGGEILVLLHLLGFKTEFERVVIIGLACLVPVVVVVAHIQNAREDSKFYERNKPSDKKYKHKMAWAMNLLLTTIKAQDIPKAIQIWARTYRKFGKRQMERLRAEKSLEEYQYVALEQIIATLKRHSNPLKRLWNRKSRNRDYTRLKELADEFFRPSDVVNA